jgi:hypothetical protein
LCDLIDLDPSFNAPVLVHVLFCLAGDVFEELNEYDGNPEEDGDGGSGLMDDDAAAAAAAGEQQQDGDS